jgi:twinkle protein
MALFQAIKRADHGTKWAAYDPAVVSLTKGASGAAEEIGAWSAEIQRNFKEVCLVFDEDEAGREAVKKVAAILPAALRCGTLPAKDPNECIMKGFLKGLVNAVKFKAEIPKNTHLVDLTTLFEQAKVPPVYGLSWPWEGMTKLTRGIRFGETIYFGAGVKMGKSEMVNSLAVHLVREHGLKVMMAKPEEANVKTSKLLLGKWAGRIFHDPEVEFDEVAYDKATNEFPMGSVLGVNLYQHLKWEGLRTDIIAAQQEGCRAVFIDPISNLVRGMPSSEANTKLEEIATDLAALAKDLDMICFIFCHVKAAEQAPPHEFGGRVMSHQFHGSRAMMRACHMMLGIEGNKDPIAREGENEEAVGYRKNTRLLTILEDREYGATGSVKLYWDPNTSLFNEVKE